jgi:DNA-binding CsgD family transcriptional regulator
VVQTEAQRTGLSAAESKIAELVARGLTNREVATTLDISTKTVEWNLTKIYRSLRIRSRTELAARYGQLTSRQQTAGQRRNPSETQERVTSAAPHSSTDAEEESCDSLP